MLESFCFSFGGQYLVQDRGWTLPGSGIGYQEQSVSRAELKFEPRSARMSKRAAQIGLPAPLSRILKEFLQPSLALRAALLHNISTQLGPHPWRRLLSKEDSKSQHSSKFVPCSSQLDAGHGRWKTPLLPHSRCGCLASTWGWVEGGCLFALLVYAVCLYGAGETCRLGPLSCIWYTEVK